MTQQHHNHFMQCALQQALRAQGRTHPNPIVGCVIVKNGTIIATGYHEQAGLPHAEIVALQAAGTQAQEADLYVTLEPCNHHGKTGPCTEAIINAGIARVFIGTQDPNPHVNGQGIQRLQQAGIQVFENILDSECQHANRFFMHAVQHQEPYIGIKIAQSLDGKIATHTGHSQWITGPEARAYGHQLRNQYDAIAVGIGTVLADDPKLTCRLEHARNPIRIVFDTHAQIPIESYVVQTASQYATWLITKQSIHPDTEQKLTQQGVRLFKVPQEQSRVSLTHALHAFYQAGLTSILIEGGPTLIGTCFDLKKVQACHVFIAPFFIGGKQARTSIEGKGVDTLQETLLLQRCTQKKLGQDYIIEGEIKQQ